MGDGLLKASGIDTMDAAVYGALWMDAKEKIVWVMRTAYEDPIKSFFEKNNWTTWLALNVEGKIFAFGDMTDEPFDDDIKWRVTEHDGPVYVQFNILWDAIKLR